MADHDAVAASKDINIINTPTQHQHHSTALIQDKQASSSRTLASETQIVSCAML